MDKIIDNLTNDPAGLTLLVILGWRLKAFDHCSNKT